MQVGPLSLRRNEDHAPSAVSGTYTMLDGWTRLDERSVCQETFATTASLGRGQGVSGSQHWISKDTGHAKPLKFSLCTNILKRASCPQNHGALKTRDPVLLLASSK